MEEEEDNNNVALETNILIDEMVIALMKYWFPNRLPVGDDYEKWVEIAMGDANAIYRHLITIGVVEELQVDE
jgi:hypothetical protein